MATPDGAAIAWMLRQPGFPDLPRISGTQLMRAYLGEASQRAEPIFLPGGTPETLAALQRKRMAALPSLIIAGAISPPFRPITAAEDAAMLAQFNASGARTVWLGLGCASYEKWMLAHRGRVQAVMLGVGAAFDFIFGTRPRARAWMQAAGLACLYRMASQGA